MQENLPQQLESPPGKSTAAELLGEEFLKSLPDSMAQEAVKLPPEWLSLDEDELKKVCFPTHRADGGKWTGKSTFETDQRLRALFWMEKESADAGGTKMRTNNICRELMTSGNFIGQVVRNPRRLAWILCPFGSHTAEIALLLKTGNDKVREILNMPLMRKICRCHWGCICPKKMKEFNAWKCACQDECVCPELLDTKLGDLVIKLYEKIELRAKGSVPQVINQRINSLNIHAHKTLPSQPEIKDLSMEELDRKILELEIATESTKSLPAPDKQVSSFVSASSLTPTDNKFDAIEAEFREEKPSPSTEVE